MSRMQTGFALMRYTFSLLKSDKKLFLFPIFSMLACFCLSVTGAIILSTDLIAYPSDSLHQPLHWTVYLEGFIFYFLMYLIVIFFNTALAANIIEYTHGKQVSIGYGLARAWDNIELIVRWTLLSATIGLILHHLTNQSHRVGRIISSILGVTWNMITYFVIPIFVVEHLGPINAIKRSAGLVKKTWGESLTSVLGLGVLTILGAIIAAAPFVLGALLNTSSSMKIGGILTIILGFLVFISVASLTMILRCTLYLYAKENFTPPGMDPLLLQTAFSKQ